jgi:hypothetical protein
MKKRLSLFIIIFSIQFGAIAGVRDLDSVYKIPTNPFWELLLSQNNLKCNVRTSFPNNYISTEGTIYKLNGQEIIKSGEHLFIQISQTGMIFSFESKEDSMLIFKRLDKTININYNIDATQFIYQNELYNYGGYGFWKSNGALRRFNQVDKEWDIVPLNKEVISIYYNWFSDKEGRVYVPYEREMNGGIVGYDKGVKRYDSYYLDINKREWVSLGNLSKELIEITKDDWLNGIAINTEEGYLYLQNDQVFLLDFIHNQVWSSNRPDLNQFLTRRRTNMNMFVFDHKIYSYNPIEKNLLVLEYKKNDFTLMPYPIWAKSNNTLWYIVGVVIIVLISIALVWFVRQSMRLKIQSAQLKMLKTKSIQQAFVGTELTLIELLLSANAKNKKVEIHQINHVLGIKDKNVGLQKKVRSDVMNAINEKYQFITQSDVQLISSVRREEDKRFFEYFITPSEVKQIEKIIHTKED